MTTTKSLCEICLPKQWKTISTDMLMDEGFPVYGANGVIGCYSEYNHEHPTLLVTCRGATCGTLNICQPYSYVNGNAMALDNLIDEVDINFLYYYLLNRGFEDVITGSAQPQIVRQSLQKVSVTYPSKEKQREIVITLEKVSELIALRKKQLAKLDQLVKSRFIELFGDPETNPHKWPSSKLSEFCDLQNGYAFKSQDYLDNSKVLNCRMSNIRPDGGFDAEYHPKYLPDTFWEKHKEYRLVDGDVIIAMTDMASDPKILGVPTIVRTRGHKFLLNQRVGKLSFYDNKSINNVYLMFVLSQKNIRQQLVKSAGGSTQINVGKPAVLGVEFFVPPLVLQNQFAAFVDQTDKSKLAIQQSLDKLETLKKSLMQEYFG